MSKFEFISIYNLHGYFLELAIHAPFELVIDSHVA